MRKTEKTKKARITKVKVVKVTEVAPEKHIIATELHVEGASQLPTLIPEEEVLPTDNGPAQRAATGHWYDFLKGLW